MALPWEKQNIIAILGIESLPDGRKVAIVEQISGLVQKRLMMRILEVLADPDREELEKILGLAQNEQQLQEFLSAKVPDLANWTEEEAVAVKKELAEFVEKEKNVAS